jgi:putative transposase
MHELQSKIDKRHKASYLDKNERAKYKNSRRKWRREMGRLSTRIKNLRRDMHWKISGDIVLEHKYIFISRFQASDMVKRISRKIQSETVRKMLQWSHFEFRQRLEQKAEEFGSVVHEVGEHYSSKGCRNCGWIHWKLGGAKTFHCPYCYFKIDRDVNGARNILIMSIEPHLVLNPSLS